MPYATRCAIIIIATCPFVNPFCPFPKGFGHGKNAENSLLRAPSSGSANVPVSNGAERRPPSRPGRGNTRNVGGPTHRSAPTVTCDCTTSAGAVRQPSAACHLTDAHADRSDHAPDPAMPATLRAAEGGGPYIHTQTSRSSRRGRPAWRPGGPAATWRSSRRRR